MWSMWVLAISQNNFTLNLPQDKRTSKRLGLHCPYNVFETVTQNAAVSAEKRAKIVAAKDSRDDKQNRHLLMEMFPRMPAKSMQELLEHGFQKGSGRVGRATKLDEGERIELAVHAHARHNFTDYDSYLIEQRKAGDRGLSPRDKARKRVHKQVKSIANSWRPDKSDTNGTSEPRRYPQRVTTIATKVPKKPRWTKAEKLARQRITMVADNADARRPEGKHLGVKTALEAEAAVRRQRKKARRKARKATGATVSEVPLNAIEETNVAGDVSDNSPGTPALVVIESSGNELSRTQRCRNKALESIDKLKADPYLELQDKEMWRVRQLHKKMGGTDSSLGSAVEERFSGMMRRRADRIAAKKAQRKERKAKAIATTGGAEEKLLRQFELMDVSDDTTAGLAGNEPHGQAGDEAQAEHDSQAEDDCQADDKSMGLPPME